jgi:hypothetical protein
VNPREINELVPNGIQLGVLDKSSNPTVTARKPLFIRGFLISVAGGSSQRVVKPPATTAEIPGMTRNSAYLRWESASPEVA